jgi:hypothetical protein
LFFYQDNKAYILFSLISVRQNEYERQETASDFVEIEKVSNEMVKS